MSERNSPWSQRAQDVLTCRLCTQYLRDPRQLPCGHSFCLQCLEKYYRTECQRSETGRLRSPSVERRRRGLLPCPAAPVCLHVAIVPDNGVAGFPVNQKIADIKEHVVNEMAYNISKKLGRSPHLFADPDTTSVRSDETDFSDISCETTRSEPATGSFDHHNTKSPYSKFAKYFEAQTDGSPETSSNYTPTRRSDRRRVAISSSFQHRRRRVHTPSPTAFDDSTPSRCGSAPHLDSYQPTVRPRQGSSVASPLLRRARPTSCILEELVDDKEFFNHLDEKTRLSEAELQSPLTERRRQPVFRERVVLPTHRENIPMDEGRRSKPAEQEQARPHSHNVRTSSTVPGHDDHSRHSKHHSETSDAGKNPTNTTSSVPARDEPSRAEPSRQQKQHSGSLDTGDASNNAAPMHHPSEKHGKHSETTSNPFISTPPHTGTTFSSTPTHAEPTINYKPHSNNVKTDKTPTSVPSRPGRRVLPKIPTESGRAETFHGSAGDGDGTADVNQPRRRPNVEKFISTERRHTSGNVHHEKDPPDHSTSSAAHTSHSDKVKSSTTVRSEPNKSHSRTTNFTDKQEQKTADSKLASSAVSSGPAGVKSSSSNLGQTCSRSSVSEKMHGVDRSKSTVSGTKSSSAGDSSLSQKAQESRKFSSDSNASRQKSTVTTSKVEGSGGVKTSLRDGHSTPSSQGSKFGHKDGRSDGHSTQNIHDSKLGRKDMHSDGHSKPNSCGSKSAHEEEHADVHSTPKTQDSKPLQKDERSRVSGDQTKRQSESSPQSEQSPSNKSQSSKSRPGSGSRLTYKVNAATIQPVLMNRKKTKLNSPDPGQKSFVDTAAETGTGVGEPDEDVRETVTSDDIGMSSENVEMQEENSDVTSFSQHSKSNVKATYDVNLKDCVNEEDYRRGLSVDCDDARPSASVPRNSSHSSQDRADRHSTTTNKHNTGDDLQEPRHPTAHVDTDSAADAAPSVNEDAKNAKKKQQWNDFMATLQAARTKYSSTDNQRSLSSEATRPAPVYNDHITPCWRIQRDDFAVPTSIAIAADGSAIIADVANCLLDFADVDGNIVHSVTGTKPFSVAIGHNGNIYVGDRRSRTVRVFDIYGTDVAQWDAEATGFGWIAGIAALRNGQLAIIDRERCKVDSESYFLQ